MITDRRRPTRSLESDHAWDDERRDAIDRIAKRCAERGITCCQEIVAAIRDGLADEMRPLIEVRISRDPRKQRRA